MFPPALLGAVLALALVLTACGGGTVPPAPREAPPEAVVATPITEEPRAHAVGGASESKATEKPTATPTPAVVDEGGPGAVWAGTASHYGQNYDPLINPKASGWLGCARYENQRGDNIYDTTDPSIAATLQLAEGGLWSCGTRFLLTGPAGTIRVIRQDSCPGCGPRDIDLSEAGFERVCGPLSVGRCDIAIEVLD